MILQRKKLAVCFLLTFWGSDILCAAHSARILTKTDREKLKLLRTEPLTLRPNPLTDRSMSRFIGSPPLEDLLEKYIVSLCPIIAFNKTALRQAMRYLIDNQAKLKDSDVWSILCEGVEDGKVPDFHQLYSETMERKIAEKEHQMITTVETLTSAVKEQESVIKKALSMSAAEKEENSELREQLRRTLCELEYTKHLVHLTTEKDALIKSDSDAATQAQAATRTAQEERDALSLALAEEQHAHEAETAEKETLLKKLAEEAALREQTIKDLNEIKAELKKIEADVHAMPQQPPAPQQREKTTQETQTESPTAPLPSGTAKILPFSWSPFRWKPAESHVWFFCVFIVSLWKSELIDMKWLDSLAEKLKIPQLGKFVRSKGLPPFLNNAVGQRLVNASVSFTSALLLKHIIEIYYRKCYPFIQPHEDICSPNFDVIFPFLATTFFTWKMGKKIFIQPTTYK